MRKIPLLLFIVYGTFYFGKLCNGDGTIKESSEEYGKIPQGISKSFKLVPVVTKYLMESVDNHYNIKIADEEFCIRASTLGKDNDMCYPYNEMNEIFDQLEKKEKTTENGKKDEEFNEVVEEIKLRMRQEELATTPNCSAVNKEIIQEMHSRIEGVDHLIIDGNGSFETWPIEHLKNLYKFQINKECDVFSGETFPEELKLISYDEVVFNKRPERIQPTIIRELLMRCRNKTNEGEKKTKKEAFCHSGYPKMAQKIIEAVVGKGSDFYNSKEIVYVAYQNYASVIDFIDQSIELEVFDNKQFETTTNNWKTIRLFSEDELLYDWSDSIFEKSSQTVTYLDIRNLRESGTLDTLSTALSYFENCSQSQSLIRFKSLRFLVLSVLYENIDETAEELIKYKMTRLIRAIEDIAVVALVNTVFTIKSDNYCPDGWKSFHNTAVVGCYKVNGVADLVIPSWIHGAIYPQE